jgi:nitronate monooxygenase
VPIIITSLRPPGDVVDAVHSYGGLVFHDVISLRHAHKAMEQGVDGIIAVCAGAGGHAGPLSPFALVKEIRLEFDGVLILSGAMSSGGDILAAQAMGADLAYIGTRFIATREANAPDEYKQMIVSSKASDIVYTPDNLPDVDKSAMDFASSAKSGAKAWRDIWGAGQGVGSIDDVLPTHDLVRRIEAEYQSSRARLLGTDRSPA